MLKRIQTGFVTVAEWLRAGYPTGAPRKGHAALLALNGPLALTLAQKARVTAELGSSTLDIAAIEVAITKATNRLPVPSQTRELLPLLSQLPIRR